MLFKRIKDWATTITAFRTGDVIPVDGPYGTAKMSKDSLLELTAQNVLAGNVAPAFDPTRTSENPYKAGESVTYEGKTYTFEVSHYGPWDASHVVQKSLAETAMKVMLRQIYSGNSNNLSDLNDAEHNSVYVISRDSNTTTLNFPTEFSGEGFLHTYKSDFNIWGGHFIFQILVQPALSNTWIRRYNSATSSWSGWKFSNAQRVSDKQIFGNWDQNLADLNDADINAVYFLQPTAATTTQHLPDGFKGHQGIMFTVKADFSAYYYQTWQIILRLDNNSIYYRAYGSNNSSWTQWYTSEPNGREKIYVGVGEEYTSLRSALEYAYTHHNVDVHVKKGTYDLVADFATEIATHESGTNFGAPLGNGCYYFFEPGAKVLAMCEKGDLSNEQWGIVNVCFNPLDAKGSDFTIEGLDIEAQDCRYCVHDDNGWVSTPYSHTYKNCRMVKHCTSNVDSNKQFTQCIGGGFGKTATINVDGGWYKSEAYWGYADIDGGNVDQNQTCISYHNGRGEGYQSVVFVKDVFIADRGYVAAIDLDVSTSVSQFYVCGCRLGMPSQHQEGPTHNTAITTWNCDIANEGTWVPSGDDDWKVSWVPANS